MQKMSKLYWHLFIIVLLMLTCMPIKGIVAPKFLKKISFKASNTETSSSNEEDRPPTPSDGVLSNDLNYLFNTYENLPISTKYQDTWKTEDIIKYYRYPFEEHTVTTEDNYILVLHRIPQKTDVTIKRNFPVLIPHSFGGSSADWVFAGPEGSLAMQLSNQGYDVWLANNRGNAYSRKHKKYKIKSKRFWNFSLHELGKYDLPAIINHIRRATNKQQLHYIGYSMSTCIFYIMAIEKVEYQEYIRSQISMAPVSRLGGAESTVRNLTAIDTFLNHLLKKKTYEEFNSETSWMRKILKKICDKKGQDEEMCLKFIILAIYGINKNTFNMDLLPRIIGHYPASMSSKIVAHLAQFIRRDKFAQFNYSGNGNHDAYGSQEPPLYDLEKIKVPITLMYGQNDKLVQPRDAEKLKEKLPMIMNFIKIDDPNFNHLDFLWNRFVKEKVNDLVVRTLGVTDNPSWKYDSFKTSNTQPWLSEQYNSSILPPEAYDKNSPFLTFIKNEEDPSPSMQYKRPYNLNGF